jgi:hypothetical protein
MSILKVSSAREALFAFRMSLPWLKVPVCSSCHLVFLLHAGLYLQLHCHFNGTDTVQVIYMRAEELLDPLKAGFRIRINLSCWIRIRIRIQIADPDPDPGGKK